MDEIFLQGWVCQWKQNIERGQLQLLTVFVVVPLLNWIYVEFLLHFTSENPNRKEKTKWFTKKWLHNSAVHYTNTIQILGIRVGPGGRDRTLAVKSRKTTWKSAFVKRTFLLYFFFDIPSSCAKIWGLKKICFLSIPEVGEKQKA